jgi:hypothetical protein
MVSIALPKHPFIAVSAFRLHDLQARRGYLALGELVHEVLRPGSLGIGARVTEIQHESR